MLLVIDAVRRKRRVALSELRALRVELPDLQRQVDQERVAEIARYHAARGGVCLAGGDIVLAVDSDGRRWLVDGQHRYLAALGLAGAFPDAALCVEEVDLAARGAPTLGELFRLINRAVPVPDYVVAGTLRTHERGAVDRLGALVRARFGPFLSASRRPRRPNVNLDLMLDRVAAEAAGALAPLIAQGGGDRAFAYLLAANERVGAACPAAARARAEEKARRHGGAAPLFLAEDPEAAWASDAAAVSAFAAARGDPPGEAEPQPPEAFRPGKRPPLPTALRHAVWNAAHGERAGEGACYCCGKAVTHQAFECGHVVPVAHGGDNTVANMRVLCRSCNRSMGTEHLEAFKSRLGLAGPR